MDRARHLLLSLDDDERDFLLRLLAAHPPRGEGFTASPASLDELSPDMYRTLWSALDEKGRSARDDPADSSGEGQRNQGGRPRQRASGWAYAGSQRHIQAYVNTPILRHDLDKAIGDAIPGLGGLALEWRAPLAVDSYEEPSDQSVWPAINRLDLANAFAEWWPARGGPSWDAIALATSSTGEGSTALLVEAKAHPAEFGGPGMGASNPNSISMIEAALDECRLALGANAPLTSWTSRHYQLANRLAWAWRLREAGQDAFFVYVGFADDRSNVSATTQELEAAALEAYAALGLDRAATQDLGATVILPATG